MKLISLLPINIREAEKEETDTASKEGGEEKNPFADSEGGGGEEEETDTTDSSEEGGEEKEGGEESTDGSKPLDVVFNPSRVRKYNDVKFKDNKGTVVGVSRFGISVKLPDEQTIFVNFEDIL